MPIGPPSDNGKLKLNFAGVVEDCTKGPKIIDVSMLKIERVGINDVTMKGIIRAMEDVNQRIQVKLDVEKKGKDQKYQYYTQLPLIMDICEHIQDDKRLWTPLVRAVKPLLKCPLKAGNYTVSNIKLDLNQVPVDNQQPGDYRVTAKVLIKNHQEIFCLRLCGVIERVN